MEPDKTYPLHSDDASQPPASSNLPANEQESALKVPSKYNETQQAAQSKPANVPWYLQPLTKTTDTPLTSSQTRPFVPRQPLPPVQQNDGPDMSNGSHSDQGSDVSPDAAEIHESSQSNPQIPLSVQTPPVSPFRSTPTAVSSQRWSRQPESLSSADRFQMPGQPKVPEYQQALSAATPKPFSQFGSQPTKQSVKKDSTKPKKLRKITGILLAILLVAGIATGGYWLWRSINAPSAPAPSAVVASAEEKLYRALENHLNTSKIHQVYEQTTVASQTSTVTIDATSDFSDPRAPKSFMKYETKSGESDQVINGSGELIVIDKGEYYAKLTKPAIFYNGADNVAPKENQWYVIKSDDVRSEVLMDPLGARSSINASVGEFPVGSFNDQTRKDLMQYIKDQNVYKVVSNEQVEIDGKKMAHYTLIIDADKLNELNRKVVVAVGGNADEMPFEFMKSDKQNTEIWISDDTTRIAKIKIERESASGSGGQVVKVNTIVTIDYPDDVSKIKKPEAVQPPTW